MKNYEGREVRLVSKTGEPIKRGELLHTATRSITYQLTGFFPPHKPNVSGKVYVRLLLPGGDFGQTRIYYAGVFNAHYEVVS